ncbi:MAG: 6-carboxytetrahydropterin synthase [Dehalococcoidia bacterium]|nr:6-carboxytetrahydropterin synthase [Dehalococcoidia bacterium]
MYRLTVRRDFVAQHFLIGGDWGPENNWHSHHYMLELQLEGATLDQHGYLVDIVAVNEALDEFVAAHRDKTLNDLPTFAGLNPSIEHFARIAAETLSERLSVASISAVTTTIWENDIACASYRLER